MEEPTLQAMTQSDDLTQVEPKLTYDPPQAIFVPLQVEERLLVCFKDDMIFCISGPMLS